MSTIYGSKVYDFGVNSHSRSVLTGVYQNNVPVKYSLITEQQKKNISGAKLARMAWEELNPNYARYQPTTIPVNNYYHRSGGGRTQMDTSDD